MAVLLNGMITTPNESVNIVDQSVIAFTVARVNPTYAFQVDTNTASSVTGVKITADAVGNGVAITTLSTGTNENITIDAKGSGVVNLGSVSTGGVGIGGTDVLLFRDAANILAQRNGTTAQDVRFYNTFTSATNAEWLSLNS